MKNFTQLKQLIIATIKENGVGAITGPVLQEQLLDMVEAMEFSEFMGIATSDTTPITDAKCNHFYIAVAPGDYSAFIEDLTLVSGDVLMLVKQANETEWTSVNLTAGLMDAIEAIGEQKQDLLTAGDGIVIENNVVAAKVAESGKLDVTAQGISVQYAEDLADPTKLITAKAVVDKITELAGNVGGYPILDENEQVEKDNLPEDVTYHEEGTEVDDELIDEYERTLAKAYQAIEDTITARNRTYQAIADLQGLSDAVNSAIRISQAATADSEDATLQARAAVAQLTSVLSNVNQAILEAHLATNATTAAIQTAQQASSQVISDGVYAHSQGDLAAQKAALATSAAALATEKAESAEDNAAYAKEQGDYAKEQGDYAVAEITDAKGDYDSINDRFLATENALLTAEEEDDPTTLL